MKKKKVSLTLYCESDVKEFETLKSKIVRRAERQKLWNSVPKDIFKKVQNFPSLNASEQDWDGQVTWAKLELLPLINEYDKLCQKWETFKLMSGAEHDEVKDKRIEVVNKFKERLSVWGLDPVAYQPNYFISGGKIKEPNKFFRLKKNRKQYGVSKAPKEETSRKEN